jgi:PAS domain S-box-containing protein
MPQENTTIEKMTREQLITEISSLKESHAKYKEVFYSMIDVYVRLNRGGYLEMVSPSMFDAFGYAPEDMIGKKAINYFVNPSDHDLINQLIIEKGYCDNFQSRIYTKKREIKVVSINAKTLTDSLGKRLGHDFIIKDVSEQKNTEQEIKVNNWILEELEEIAHLGHLSWSVYSNKFNWSNELYRICRFDPDVSPSIKGSMNIVHPDDLSYVKKNLNLALRQIKEYNLDHRIVCADNGEVKWIQAEIRLSFDSNGNLTGLLGTILDITKKKKRQSALLRSEEEFRSIYENTYSGIHLFSLDGTFLKANQRFIDLLGYTENELLTMTIAEVTHPDDRAQTQEKLEALIQGEITHFEVEKCYIKKSGEELFCNIAMTAPLGIDGTPEFLTASLTDITKNKRIQEIHKGISEIQRTFIGEVTSKIFFKKILQTLLRITRSSVGCIAEIQEQDGKQVLITHSRIVLSAIDSQETTFQESYISVFEELTMKILTTGKHLLLGKNRRINDSRSSGELENFMGLPFYINTKLVGMVCVANKKYGDYDNFVPLLRPFLSTCSTLIAARKNEITRIAEEQASERMKEVFINELELKVTERTEDLQRTQKELSISLEKEKNLGALKSRFVSTASHQFRTPLTVIQSNMGILSMQKDLMGSQLKKTFEKTNKRIISQISSMSSMMNDLLFLGKIDLGNIIPEFGQVNLVELCQEIIDNHNEIQNDQRRMDLTIIGETSTLELDANLITHAISNLVSNAFKYSENKPAPTMRLWFKEDSTQLSIIDYGLGIPVEDLTNLFEPFYRASNVAEVSGTGLGTTIAKEYVELNNGSIEVNSTLLVGTEFILTF